MTVLGSCIGVALFDPVKKQGGINHFMLTKDPGKKFFASNAGKYGMAAMELVINDLLKLGSRKEDLVAHVVGGSTTMGYNYSRIQSVAVQNIRFTFRYLDTEGIPISSIEVGGPQGRKLLFNPSTGQLKIKLITSKGDVIKNEAAYMDKISKPPANDNYILF